MEERLQRRIGRNEALFREVNEAIARGQWPGEEDQPVGFVCECASLSCNQIVELSMRAYQAVRADARRFVIAVGHDVPEVERVVESRASYEVVEKGDEAGRVAALEDSGR